ncbi:MAG TPA: hypothetical protein VFV98_05305 [Vicinamibacterales bacterium]|nr:hypothetical protein [Vicinamibacterales bacterium]
MPPLRRLPAAIRIYGAALWLCPPSFRRQYGDQMLRDFVEARGDARAAREPRAVHRFAAQMTVDLARTVVIQWIRTGAIVIAAAAMLCTLALTTALVGFVQRIRVDVPPRQLELDTLFVVLMVSVIVVVIASAIIFTHWFAASIRRQPHRRLRY